MSCYKCHTDHYRIYFNHHHTFFNSIFFFLDFLTFFILNRNSFTFGSYTLGHRYPQVFIVLFVLKHNYYFGLFWFCFAWLGFGCEGCSGQQWWRKEAKNETFCPFFVVFFILADVREIILTWIHFGSVLQSSLPTGEW